MNHTLTVPGADLYYELRGSGPLVALVGSPMGARSFASVADLIASDYTVLTTDPRGIDRSTVSDPDQDSTPQLRAADLSALLTKVDAGPAIVFGSSGGAITALAFAQAYPDQARTVIAHEPPLCELLEDRDELHAGTEKLIATYLDGDILGAWGQFMAQANIDLPPGVLELMFGPDRPAAQLADERRWFEHELRWTTSWKPDLPVLRAGRPRIIAAIGEASTGQLCDRTTRALASALDIEPTMFPGGHTAFADNPPTFAPRLLEVLATA
ncbi:pimeloyl-ACP methyl ester carboxylesterase [Kribbella voronezhensis]|uniref:Pimeloyl-ACP methyl ester carboxylesterase n=1 Tax=Kribbella voronezhensis TaxID=2512212 RepID=A0A4R7T087_9ACTN|nr:alpha/beta hydrolase [Kribbella voronezhensis]TDU84436.1 pimeloyl-ACP methyl ester carboxylesterase [Kribbella voronezhensis]